MAFATQITLSTSNKVSINYQTRDVTVAVTYQLEREDTDLLQVVCEKTGELAQAHRLAWQGLRDAIISAAPPGSEELRSQTENEQDHLPIDTLVEPTAPLEPATMGQRGALRVLLDQAGWKEERIAAHLREQFGCERIEDLQAVQAAEWLLELQRAARVAAQQAVQQQKDPSSLNGARHGIAKR